MMFSPEIVAGWAPRLASAMPGPVFKQVGKLTDLLWRVWAVSDWRPTRNRGGCAVVCARLGNSSHCPRLDNPRRMSMKRSNPIWTVAGALLFACTPVLDWRESRPGDSGGLRLLFPCKPDSQARQVRLGARPVRLILHACTAGGTTWALAFADLGDPAQVGPALSDLRASAARNLGAAQSQPMQLSVPGATPNSLSHRVQLQGHMPDGRAVTGQVAVFAKGTHIFQVTALGEQIEADAADAFFAGLRFTP
jgi:hypothetical protein